MTTNSDLISLVTLMFDKMTTIIDKINDTCDKLNNIVDKLDKNNITASESNSIISNDIYLINSLNNANISDDTINDLIKNNKINDSSSDDLSFDDSTKETIKSDYFSNKHKHPKYFMNNSEYTDNSSPNNTNTKSPITVDNSKKIFPKCLFNHDSFKHIRPAKNIDHCRPITQDIFTNYVNSDEIPLTLYPLFAITVYDTILELCGNRQYKNNKWIEPQRLRDIQSMFERLINEYIHEHEVVVDEKCKQHTKSEIPSCVHNSLNAYKRYDDHKYNDDEISLQQPKPENESKLCLIA